MKHDFDTIISRRGTNYYKWDTAEEENVLPMGVADMDFRTAPAIIDALQTVSYTHLRDDVGNIVYGTEGDNTGMPLVEGDGNTVKVGDVYKRQVWWGMMHRVSTPSVVPILTIFYTLRKYIPIRRSSSWSRITVPPRPLSARPTA